MKSSLFVKYFIGGCGQSLINKNYHNSRGSDDIGINIGPVTKNDKENTSTSKKLMIVSSRQVVSSLSFFQGQFGAIRKPGPDVNSVKLTFSLVVTCYLAKIRTKKSHTIALSKDAIFDKRC